MKLSEACKKYKDEYMFFKGFSRAYTNHYCYQTSCMINFFGDIEVEDLTLDDIRHWVTYLSGVRRPNTVRNYISMLRQILRYCRKCGVNCLDSVFIPCPPRMTVSVNYVTPEEVQKIIDSSDSLRTKFIVSLLYAFGVRLSEMISLNRNDIKEMRFRVIGKGGKERLCFIDERTKILMERYLSSREDHESALVVSDRFKTRVSPSTVQLIVRNAVRRAGINKKITPHTFRHGYATDLVKNGCDIRYVAQSLGHSQLNTTMIYTHIVNPDLQEKYRKCHTF